MEKVRWYKQNSLCFREKVASFSLDEILGKIILPVCGAARLIVYIRRLTK
jgi:hypothetical protein